MELRLAAVSVIVACLPGVAQTRNPPPPGRLVDVGGYRVHLYCTGKGSPAVAIVGAGFSFDWSLVQPEVAKFARVCTYDPAGTAWSDAGPGPNCSDRVEEIHQALRKGGPGGPYVLVGLSMGGLTARLYASRYPRDVAGMVLVDHTMVDGDHTPPPVLPPPGPNSPPVLLQQTPIVIEGDEDYPEWPPHVRELRRWALSKHPVRPTIETVETCQAGLAAQTELDMPLAVVSTGNQNFSYVEFQKRLVALSRNSKQFVASKSGHSIEIDQPGVVVDAIRYVVRRGRE